MSAFGVFLIATAAPLILLNFAAWLSGKSANLDGAIVICVMLGAGCAILNHALGIIQ